MTIDYQVNFPLSTEQFIEILKASTLAERRPVDDLDCMAGMIKNSNLTVTAWDSSKLVGIARCVTDFHYACYLSDLAVAESHQKQGIGKHLQHLTQQQLGPLCKLILLAAPAARRYYGHIGFTHNEHCWILDRDTRLIGEPDKQP
jgi:GNAT superfamily N-acetyltransferase